MTTDEKGPLAAAVGALAGSRQGCNLDPGCDGWCGGRSRTRSAAASGLP